MRLVSVLFLFFSTQLYATTLKERGFEELIQRSGIIFEGEVLSKYSTYSDNNETVYTFVTFTNNGALKGTINQPTIELRFEGGVMSDETVEVVGMPKFAVGERVVLFLRPQFNATKSTSPITGFSQGKFTIQKDRDGTEHLYSSDGKKIIGYDETRDQLEMVSNPKPNKRIPVAHNPADKLVESVSHKSSQLSITKEQFVQLIQGFIQKHGLKGSEYRIMTDEEKTKSLHFDPVSAPSTRKELVKE